MVPKAVACLVAGLCVAGANVGARAAAPSTAPERLTVAAVAEMLAERPAGFGRPIDDRAAWRRLAEAPAYGDVVRRAVPLLKQPIPDSPDDLYLDFSKTGNRSRWQRVASRRRGRISRLVLAECIENHGRFLPALEKTVAAICSERTWLYPAHDRSLRNFKGEQIDIDLGSSHVASDLAMTHWLVGSRLGEAARERIRANLRRRIFDPYRVMLDGRRKKAWWMRGTNNWNAVCLANVTAAALAMIEDRRERARFVVAAAEHIKNFLRGFTSDGYCSEGVGYWNYGFGNFVLLAEAIHQATGGRVDLLASKAARAPALYGLRIEIMGGVCPAFADCSVGSRPSKRIVHFVSRRLGLGADPRDDASLISPRGGLAQAMMYSFANSATRSPPASKRGFRRGLRSWFDKAGVLIARPADASTCRLGVALKGGHNAEHHNHNDVGSYVAVVGERAVLLDPGAEVYTARTFSGRRYESKVLNSYGHPVPRVAGRLQRSGRRAAARVVRADFSDEVDTLVLDIRAAYGLAELKTLRRTFRYSRRGAGSLTVTDEVAFSEPQAFETALITLGRWRKVSPQSLLVYDFDEAVRVGLQAEGGEIEIDAEKIREDVRTKSLPTRIALRFKKPVTKAAITVTITPEKPPAAGRAMLRNGGFEQEDFCWDLGRGGMGSISSRRAAGGNQSLRIVDTDARRGSSILSARVPISRPGAFELRGKVFGVRGEGVGLYVRFLDSERRLLNPIDERGHMQPVGSIASGQGRWRAFAFGFRPPEKTAYMQLWIHSYNAARVEAFLDDLEIVRVGGAASRPAGPRTARDRKGTER